MALWISKLVNALCRPLVRRIGAELLPHVRQELAEMRRATEPAILPLVLKNEIEHMQQLPLAFLREQKQLVFVGYCSSELSGIIDGSRSLPPPIKSESDLACNCLTFLDEYHFVRLIRELPTLLVPVHKSIVFPFRGDYLPEWRIRQLLHQLGFPEVFMLTYERLSEATSISGVSNPMPVSSLPMMLNLVAESDLAIRWLIANRHPTQQ